MAISINGLDTKVLEIDVVGSQQEGRTVVATVICVSVWMKEVHQPTDIVMLGYLHSEVTVERLVGEETLYLAARSIT